MIGVIIFQLVFGLIFYCLFGFMLAIIAFEDFVFNSSPADAITYFIFWPLFLIKLIMKGVVRLCQMFAGSSNKNVFMNFIRLWRRA